MVVTPLPWPLATRHGAALEAEGFASSSTAEGTTGWEFHGPDAEVLFADWFVQSHCFGVAQGRGDTLALTFRPARRNDGRVDIAGRLLLDARTLALQRIEFEHQGLPPGMPAGSVSGWVQFASDTAGTWLPVAWMIRAPIAGAPPRIVLPSGSVGRTTRMSRIGSAPTIGYREVRGEVFPERSVP
jgi:hypothetical protein